MVAMLWVFVVSLLLFWLPFIGPLIAGIVGGKKAGGFGSALLAVFLPGVLLGVALFFLASFASGMPVIGVVAATGGVTFALANVGPLLLGAIVGAVIV